DPYPIDPAGFGDQRLGSRPVEEDIGRAAWSVGDAEACDSDDHRVGDPALRGDRDRVTDADAQLLGSAAIDRDLTAAAGTTALGELERVQFGDLDPVPAEARAPPFTGRCFVDDLGVALDL